MHDHYYLSGYCVLIIFFYCEKPLHLPCLSEHFCRWFVILTQLIHIIQISTFEKVYDIFCNVRVKKFKNDTERIEFMLRMAES